MWIPPPTPGFRSIPSIHKRRFHALGLRGQPPCQPPQANVGTLSIPSSAQVLRAKVTNLSTDSFAVLSTGRWLKLSGLGLSLSDKICHDIMSFRIANGLAGHAQLQVLPLQARVVEQQGWIRKSTFTPHLSSPTVAARILSRTRTAPRSQLWLMPATRAEL